MSTEIFSSLREASAHAGVTYEAIRKWIAIYPGLAIEEGGRWRISRRKLDEITAARSAAAATQATLRASA